jgi:restriction system protein
MKQYFRVMLGSKSVYFQQCFEGNFIGADYDIHQDLSTKLSESKEDFNKMFRPLWLEANPNKSIVSAGLSCGMLWTLCKGIKKGDIVLCPDGQGNYHVGEVDSDYYYKPNEILFHRRNVNWYPEVIERSSMTQELKNSTGSLLTICDLTSYSDEIEKLIGGQKPPTLISTDSTVEDPSVFALEKHLEDFLVQNWKQTELGKNYDIFEEDGIVIGQQYPSDTGPIDILAISKDKKTLLVVELKKGRVSDNVIGQIQRYMGYVKGELADSNQMVKGVIIGLEDDKRIQRALMVTNNIEFYRYKVNFELFKS